MNADALWGTGCAIVLALVLLSTACQRARPEPKLEIMYTDERGQERPLDGATITLHPCRYGDAHHQPPRGVSVMGGCPPVATWEPEGDEVPLIVEAPQREEARSR